MFRFNQKKANKEVDELKKLLAITKGAKKTNKSVSSLFLREDVDLTQQTPQEQPSMDPMGGQMPNEPVASTDTKEIEKAIQNSKITFSGPEEDGQVVKGYISTSGEEKGLYFKFSTKDNNPLIQTKNAILLDDDLIKSIEQIATYFDTWKSNTEK